MDHNSRPVTTTNWNSVDWKKVHSKSRLKVFMSNGGLFLTVIFLLAILGIPFFVEAPSAWVIDLILLAMFAVTTIPATLNTTKDRLIIEGRITGKREEIQSGSKGSAYKSYVFELAVSRAKSISRTGQVQAMPNDYSSGVAILVPASLFRKYNESDNITLVCLPGHRAIGILQDYQ